MATRPGAAGIDAGGWCGYRPAPQLGNV